MLDPLRAAVPCDAIEGFMPPRLETGKHLACGLADGVGNRDAEQALEGWIEGDVALVDGATLCVTQKRQLAVALPHAMEE